MNIQKITDVIYLILIFLILTGAFAYLCEKMGMSRIFGTMVSAIVVLNIVINKRK